MSKQSASASFFDNCKRFQNLIKVIKKQDKDEVHMIKLLVSSLIIYGFKKQLEQKLQTTSEISKITISLKKEKEMLKQIIPKKYLKLFDQGVDRAFNNITKNSKRWETKTAATWNALENKTNPLILLEDLKYHTIDNISSYGDDILFKYNGSKPIEKCFGEAEIFQQKNQLRKINYFVNNIKNKTTEDIEKFEQFVKQKFILELDFTPIPFIAMALNNLKNDKILISNNTYITDEVDNFKTIIKHSIPKISIGSPLNILLREDGHWKLISYHKEADNLLSCIILDSFKTQSVKELREYIPSNNNMKIDVYYNDYQILKGCGCGIYTIQALFNMLNQTIDHYKMNGTLVEQDEKNEEMQSDNVKYYTYDGAENLIFAQSLKEGSVYYKNQDKVIKSKPFFEVNDIELPITLKEYILYSRNDQDTKIPFYKKSKDGVEKLQNKLVEYYKEYLNTKIVEDCTEFKFDPYKFYKIMSNYDLYNFKNLEQVFDISIKNIIKSYFRIEFEHDLSDSNDILNTIFNFSTATEEESNTTQNIETIGVTEEY